MQAWPKLARDAFNKVLNSHISNDADAVLNQLSDNALAIKSILEKIEANFTKTVSTPEELDRQGEYRETDLEIRTRFWIIFFESFAYSASIHSPQAEKNTTKEINSYKQLLLDASEQANKLALSLQRIHQSSNKPNIPIDYELNLDPGDWIIDALEAEDNYFGNPFYDDFINANGHYDRHKPSPTAVIESLEKSLIYAYFRLKEADRYKKASGLLRTLTNEFNWNTDTRFSWHLPHHFIDSVFSGNELAELISIAWGEDIGKDVVNKAKRIIKQQ